MVWLTNLSSQTSIDLSPCGSPLLAVRRSNQTDHHGITDSPLVSILKSHGLSFLSTSGVSTIFHNAILLPKTTWLGIPQSAHLHDLTPCDLSVSLIGQKWADEGRIPGSAKHPQRTTTSTMHLQNGSTTGNGVFALYTIPTTNTDNFGGGPKTKQHMLCVCNGSWHVFRITKLIFHKYQVSKKLIWLHFTNFRRTVL